MQSLINRLLMVVLAIAALVIVGLVGWRTALDHFAGAWTHAPEDAPWVLTDSAHELVDSAFADIGKKTVVDYRIDVLSSGQPLAPGVKVQAQIAADNDKSGSPLAWLSARIREHAAGIRDAPRADAEYLSRVLRQMQAMPGDYRGWLLARDAVYGPDGKRDDDATLDYVANDYVVWLAEQAPDRLTPVVSIHPYRRDALDALARWAKAGVKRVSWQPVAQHIDLDDPKVAAFYAALVKHDMVLYLPVGFHSADNGASGWIGASVLRAPLAAGVNTIISIGGADSGDGRAVMPGLFALLRDPTLGEHLFIDLAGVLAPAQLNSVLAPLLQHPQFFDHLRYASGYPEPAIAAAISLDALADRGFIDPALIEPLRAIYDVNPMLFAFVTLRQVHLPATELTLPASVFFRS
ncbi:hypothetical protein [Salinisphaera aquimarina]|uniref:Amidohydrolase n=1 Tax=Salinisphaera aquimarina TaxID=2094031 RepID=A0ABV7EMT6_9GAMM